MSTERPPVRVSIVIPTFNGARRIGRTLEAIQRQTFKGRVEVIVVDDGSRDETAAVVSAFQGTKLLSQPNRGPAAARNNGARAASGEILLFTDDDCVPQPDWIDRMLGPFKNPMVVAAKGAYLTRQKELVARFVQAEYEDKFARMAKHEFIDFIDTYSAAFRRDVFLKYNGYDISFPTACAEDVELSYRMHRDGLLMAFVPAAQVYHTHPNKLLAYIRKKYKFAYWRVYALALNPHMISGDSHTPQLMKVQILLAVATLAAAAGAMALPHPLTVSAFLGGAATFLATTLPFTARVERRDPGLAAAGPALFFARGVAQFAGVALGMANVAFGRKVRGAQPGSRRLTAERLP
jgi:cellulose synthase/poly-beta-1,6-N-acetylglucosamine synthase-like glycosyltransferase